MHGETLERMLVHLEKKYGWVQLTRERPIRWFQYIPSVRSSLTWLRRPPGQEKSRSPVA